MYHVQGTSWAKLPRWQKCRWSSGSSEDRSAPPVTELREFILLPVTPDRLQGLYFLQSQKVWEGALFVTVTWPQAGAPEVFSTAHCTHSPSTSTHWHILSPPSSQSLSWHLQCILPSQMHLSIQIIYQGRCLLGFACALAEDTSQNPDFSLAESLEAFLQNAFPLSVKHSITCFVLFSINFYERNIETDVAKKMKQYRGTCDNSFLKATPLSPTTLHS